MSAPHPLLSRRPARKGPAVPLFPPPEFHLAQARVHEACGLARRTLALWIAACMQGPVIWVSPSWTQEQLHCDGVAQWIDPARLTFVQPRRPDDVLWTMEEVLRSGTIALAVADLPGLPGLTQVRRMHLAAENGAGAGQYVPMGLLLTPGAGGAAGVETRWQLSPAHARGPDGWRLERLRARAAPQKGWDIHRPVREGPPQIKTA